MASILTNTSAMVALQNLRTINANLTETQNQIATGKKIATAKDNSAIWAVSKVLESDVSAFKAISDSLNLGDATVAVARQASETVADLLTEMKGNIVSAQEENVDRSKIQADIDAKIQQINSIVEAASFNGLNLVKGTDDVNILGSLQRDSSGAVSAQDITITRQDLTTFSGTNGVGSAGSTDLSGQIQDGTGSAFTSATVGATGNTAVIEFNQTAGWDATDVASVTINGQTVSYTSTAADTNDQTVRDALLSSLQALDLEDITFEATGTDQITITSARSFEDVEITVADQANSGTGDGNAYIFSVNGVATGNTTTESGTVDQRAEEIFFAGGSVSEGNSYQVSLGGTAYFYTAGKGETFEDVANGLKTAVDAAEIDGITTKVAIDATTGQVSLKFDNSGTDVTLTTAAGTGGEASGGLFGLDSLSVLDNQSASDALEQIDVLLNNALDAAAAFGSDQSRIDLQSSFLSKLTDSLKAGIGSLVDADLEAASARLQALQVQQQLGIQSLSIANQAPQSILALFR